MHIVCLQKQKGKKMMEKMTQYLEQNILLPVNRGHCMDWLGGDIDQTIGGTWSSRIFWNAAEEKLL